ncbi:MAG: zinc-ribbon domain-containing protein [Planctomycetia bacterium]|nr:zinc-ribbon domain-containing protein [Planctomycetia bacterium]
MPLFNRMAFRKREIARGYINCPYCQVVRPAVALQPENYWHAFYFVVISTQPVGPEEYHCGECRRGFSSGDGFAYNFSPTPEVASPIRRCPRCNERVSLDRLKCPTCNTELDS